MINNNSIYFLSIFKKERKRLTETNKETHNQTQKKLTKKLTNKLKMKLTEPR